MFAIRARRKTVTEKDFLDAVNKVYFHVTLYLLALCAFRAAALLQRCLR
jgi:hypothetical protein